MRRDMMAAICSVFILLGTFVLSNPQAAFAAIEFNEVFLGDETYFDLYEGWTAEFGFNLTADGDTAVLYDDYDNVISTVLPTDDETSFISGAFLIESAALSFEISSEDVVPVERVTVYSGIYDGDTLLAQMTYDLGSLAWFTRVREYTVLEIDLQELGLEAYLEDGKFLSLVMAIDIADQWTANDFRIDTASLLVEATPVPIPSALWLLGSGLAACLPVSKRKVFKNSPTFSCGVYEKR